MSAQLLKLQTWAPTECAECCSGLLASRKEENLTSFEKRKKEAASQALVVRSCWLFLHAAIIASLFVIQSDLSWAWHRPHLAYLASYLLLAIANLALYANLCVSNPGYLQPGVHALSMATMKRDTESSMAAENAAELGIGWLAHMDMPLIGRRTLGWQRDRQADGGGGGHFSGGGGHFSLDRTTTLPTLPSQYTREALLDVSSPGRTWDASPSSSHFNAFDGMLGSPTATHLALDTAEAAINEAKTESAAGILAPGDRAFHGSISADPLPVTTAQVSKVRVRGASLGGEQEVGHKFVRADSEWPLDREEEEEDPSVPLLGEQREEGEPSASGGAPVSSLPQLERRPSKPLSPAPSSSRRRERTLSWWEGPNPGRWCEYCGAWQLLRSRHCHDCGRCVRRFDHHCAWVGRCIGQDNHVMFWWYLVVQLALLSWTTHVIVNGFRLPTPPSVGRMLALVSCAVPAVFLTAFVAMLLGYHTYLVLTAQTTYELVLGTNGRDAAAKVAYLRNLPRGAHPFSQGPAQNVLHFCCSSSGTTYQMPAAATAQGRASR